jgi:hypothetical protein
MTTALANCMTEDMAQLCEDYKSLDCLRKKRPLALHELSRLVSYYLDAYSRFTHD